MSTISEEKFNIGARLREERKKLGLSAEALGARLSTTGRTIRKYEDNDTSPRAAELLELSRMGADVLYIVTGARMPVGLAEPRANYTPAEMLAEFIARNVKLSAEDAELLKAMAQRLSR
ncbi:MAG: helix-turn-helix transcriptional regulator [Rhodocyclales bacterium]|nr:helix-turn-helix transcriptional regulator [Rhodocyclales bacterium]